MKNHGSTFGSTCHFSSLSAIVTCPLYMAWVVLFLCLWKRFASPLTWTKGKQPSLDYNEYGSNLINGIRLIFWPNHETIIFLYLVCNWYIDPWCTCVRSSEHSNIHCSSPGLRQKSRLSVRICARACWLAGRGLGEAGSATPGSWRPVARPGMACSDGRADHEPLTAWTAIAARWRPAPAGRTPPRMHAS